MAAGEMETLLAFLETNAPDLEQPMDVIRSTYEKMISAQPLATGYTTSEQTIGGVPCTVGQPAGDDQGVTLIYLHGGGYMLGSGRCYAGVASNFAAPLNARFVAVDYPLCPEAPAPAAQQAAVAVYEALLADGMDPARTVVAGDSAGGGLSLALALGLRDKGLPQPAALELISPWTDMTQSGDSYKSRAEKDFLLSYEALTQMAGAALAGGLDPMDQAASPLFADLTGLPPMHIQVGTHEVLLDDSTRLATRAAHAEIDCELRVWPGMPHDWTLFAQILSEGKEAMQAAAVFLRRHLP